MLNNKNNYQQQSRINVADLCIKNIELASTIKGQNVKVFENK